MAKGKGGGKLIRRVKTEGKSLMMKGRPMNTIFFQHGFSDQGRFFISRKTIFFFTHCFLGIYLCSFDRLCLFLVRIAYA